VIDNTGWKCPYCKTFYKDLRDAEGCARECVEVDDPVPVSSFVCEMCGGVEETKTAAEQCEEQHKDFEDKYYRDYLVYVNFLKLNEAANHPAQKKLVEDEK
jgi:hypothetical protein